MRRYRSVALSAVLLSGCALLRGPVYRFRQTSAPLRYELRERGEMLIDTPVGEQRRSDSAQVTLSLVIGRAHGEAWEVAVVFEALEWWVGGDFAERHADGRGLTGKPFSGRLTRDGAIQIERAPTLRTELEQLGDPAAFIADLLPPLPPTGDETLPSWPHRTSLAARSALALDVSYDGTASFAGDTTWNGRSARVIRSEGLATATGRGVPAGAPGEVEFTYTGRSVTRYVWDSRRGVLLASSARIEAEGQLELKSMQMKMPIVYHGRRELQLLR